MYMIICRASTCMDCSKRAPMLFMVNDDLWNSVVKEGLGVLCINCFCRRLGRKIRPDEFKEVHGNKINMPFLKIYTIKQGGVLYEV